MSSSAWERFWFARVPSDTLALLRIFLGLSSITKSIGLYALVSRSARDTFQLSFPAHRFGPRNWRFDDVPVPLVDGAPRLDLHAYQALELAALPLAVLFCIGLGARVAGPALALVLLSMQLFDQAAFKHHVFTLAVAVLVVGLAPCSDRFSVDSWLSLRGRRARLRSILPLRMLQTLLSGIYLFSALAKLNATWATGFLFAYSIDKHGQLPPGSLLGELQRHAAADALWLALSWSTIALELFLVVALWSRRWRPLALALGIALHASIEMSIDVGSYSTTMIALYLAFLDPRTRTTLVRIDGRAAGGAARACAALLAFLVRALDWAARFELVKPAGAGAAGGAGAVGGVAVAVVERAGFTTRARGGAALWLIARRLPLTMPFVVALDEVSALTQWLRRIFRRRGRAAPTTTGTH